ncbi:MAG: response regulator [Lachnospiraceae bacterium]|nr:response regulator [Lachnospiraceae bacterium]
MKETDTNTTGLHIALLVVMTIYGGMLVVEGLYCKWEAWVLPLLVCGVLISWVIHIRQLFTARMRIYIFAGFLMFFLLFQGVHPEGFFDLSLFAAMLLIAFSQTDRQNFIGYVYIEYLFLMILQIFNLYRDGIPAVDGAKAARAGMHIIGVSVIYRVCRAAYERADHERSEIDSVQEELTEVKGQTEDFLTNISHEIRTPINAVTGLSTLLLKEREDEKVYAILNAGEQLAAQAEDILEYTEITGGHVLLSKEEFAAADFLYDILRQQRKLFSEKGLTLIVDMDVRIPHTLYGDVAKLGRIMAHLLSNAAKFTETGGVFVSLSAAKREYGINLDIEVSDTGIGMQREEIARLSKGLYQSNRKRDRSTGGIGLGYAIIYGLVHEMEGFVRVDSFAGVGTTARVSIPLTVVDGSPCITVDDGDAYNVVSFFMLEKYKIPRVRDYVNTTLSDMFGNLSVPFVQASTIAELTALCETGSVTHIFTGREEYEEHKMFFHAIRATIRVAVISDEPPGEEEAGILQIPRPFYVDTAARALKLTHWENEATDRHLRIDLTGVTALIVDDEKMNLVVAEGLFSDYNLTIDTADSGQEAIEKFAEKEYDVIFMDHMMPGMDGIETARQIKRIANAQNRIVHFVALTANTVSSAREAFAKEGFEGFLAKPIDVAEFEHIMRKLPLARKGGA